MLSLFLDMHFLSFFLIFLKYLAYIFGLEPSRREEEHSDLKREPLSSVIFQDHVSEITGSLHLLLLLN